MYQPRSSVCVTRINLGFMINAGMLLASSRRLIFGGPVIALWLIGKSWSAIKWELIETYSEAKRQLVIETVMFLWTFSPLIGGGPLLSLWCSAQIHHCLARVVDWCVSRLVRLICCRVILTASSPGRLLICCSLAKCLLVLPPLPSGRERLGISCYTWTLWWHWPIGYVSFFLKRTADVMAPHLSVVFRWLVCLGSFLACWRQTNVTPNSERSPVLHCCQLPTNFHNISIVEGVWAPCVGSSWMIYGTQWCASNRPGCLLEMSGYLWCTSVCIPYTAECIGEWAGGSDHADWLQCSL